MPFAEPLINMLKGPDSPLSPENLDHFFNSLTHQFSKDATSHIIQTLTAEADTILPGSQIIDAHPDQVINAEADLHDATQDVNVLHEINAVHHDADSLQADAGAPDTTHDAAYAYHDDASTMGA